MTDWYRSVERKGNAVRMLCKICRILGMFEAISF